jgi:hypothetical protein
LLNIFPILPGLLNLARGVLPLSDGTPRTGAVEPPMPPTDALARIDLPYYRPPYRPPVRQRVPPFGPLPVYVMPPVWTGTPYRPWPPYGGIPTPPKRPWYEVLPFFPGDPRPDMPSTQPVYDSTPPPPPPPGGFYDLLGQYIPPGYVSRWV